MKIFLFNLKKQLVAVFIEQKNNLQKTQLNNRNNQILKDLGNIYNIKIMCGTRFNCG